MQSTQMTFNTSDIKIVNRSYIEISGVEEIISYDETSIILVICGDRATIEGEELRITELCVQDGKVYVKGKFISIVYEEIKERSGGFFARIIRG